MNEITDFKTRIIAWLDHNRFRKNIFRAYEVHIYFRTLDGELIVRQVRVCLN